MRAGKPLADSLEPSKPNSLINVPISNQLPMNLIQEEDPDIDRCDDELNDREPPFAKLSLTVPQPAINARPPQRVEQIRPMTQVPQYPSYAPPSQVPQYSFIPPPQVYILPTQQIPTMDYNRGPEVFKNE